MKNIFWSLLSLIFLFGACEPSAYYEKEFEIAPSGWTYADSLNFEIEIKDTSRLYNLYLDIAHSPEFKSQNLYTKIYTGYPDGNRTEDVVSLELAEKSGVWFGKCNSKKCRLRIPLLTRTYFKETGVHTLTTEQFMRQDSLPGINAIALRVEDIGERGK